MASKKQRFVVYAHPNGIKKEVKEFSSQQEAQRYIGGKKEYSLKSCSTVKEKNAWIKQMDLLYIPGYHYAVIGPLKQNIDDVPQWEYFETKQEARDAYAGIPGYVRSTGRSRTEKELENWIHVQINGHETWKQKQLKQKEDNVVSKKTNDASELDNCINNQENNLVKSKIVDTPLETQVITKFPEIAEWDDIKNTAVVYTDGSYCANKKSRIGTGFYMVYKKKTYALSTILETDDESLLGSQEAEKLAVLQAFNLAMVLGAENIEIRFDNIAVRDEILRLKHKNSFNQKYVELIDLYFGKIRIKLTHVKGHSGIRGNVIADKLAKRND